MSYAVKLDMSSLQDLYEVEEMGEVGLVDELIAKFRLQAPTILIELKAALGNADFATIEAKAHYLKSSAAILGGVEMAVICQKIEEGAEAACSVEECETLLKALEDIIPPTVEAILAFSKARV